MSTYIHADRENHELCIKANQGRIFGQGVLHNKPSFYSAQKIVVESSVDEQDENLGDAVPHCVYVYESVFAD